ncbi:MAG: hypothetical protein ABIR55_02145 [Burkholderiaceae bacterium]
MTDNAMAQDTAKRMVESSRPDRFGAASELAAAESAGRRAGTAPNLPPAGRFPLLLLGFAALFTGVGAGLARLGWPTPDIAASSAAFHGVLMVSGFFGVVIALERAVAIARLWAYGSPLLAGLASATAVFGSADLAAWLYLAASLVLLVGSLDIVRRQRALFTVTIALGAASWCVGNLLWALGAGAAVVAPWWLSFLILTIAGERLELARFLQPSRNAQRLFVAVLLLIGVGLVGIGRPWGPTMFALGLLALAGWLLRNDIARKTVLQNGLTRFIAVCLLSGYAWLLVGALVLLAAGKLAPGSASYDAIVHALGMGFVFSMVFGHAPIIFPAVLRVKVPYSQVFYAPLALLHGALAIRLAGDAVGNFDLLRWGALLGAVALAAFIIGTVSAVLRGRR